MSRFENAYYVSDERLEKYRPLFPLLCDEVKDAAKVIRKDEKALDRLGLLIDALFDAPEAEICITPEEGNIAENFAPIFALLAHIEKCEQEM